MTGKYRKRGMDLAGVVQHIYANTKPEGGCLVTTSHRDHIGYAKIQYGGRLVSSCSLVAQYYYGPRPEGKYIRHLCGRGLKGCVTASHLRYGTLTENTRDTMRHRSKRELSWFEKLTWEDVREIRDLRKRGCRYKDIAVKFDVSDSTVGMICRNKTWKVEHDPRNMLIL